MDPLFVTTKPVSDLGLKLSSDMWIRHGNGSRSTWIRRVWTRWTRVEPAGRRRARAALVGTPGSHRLPDRHPAPLVTAPEPALAHAWP